MSSFQASSPDDGWPSPSCSCQALLLAARAAGDEARFEVASGVRQLFLDDVEIDRLVNVELVVNEPQRHPRNPLLVPDTPWERGCQV